jgi:hypothetical protein
MSLIKINTNFDPLIYQISVHTDTEQPIRVIAYDAQQTTTVFTDRVKNVVGDYTFYVRMPQCGLKTEILVYNDNVGIIPEGMDKTFKIIDQKKLPLEYDIISIIDLTRSEISFISFAQRFAYNASVMQTGVYKSDDKKFTIELLDEIVDENGNVIPTSFRISLKDGTIQASKSMIKHYTVPILFLILMHEYSHYYINNDIDNELEADLNALNIYLGKGYPYIDAIWALAVTFEGNKTSQNEMRWQQCNKYIDDYFNEKSKYKD